MVHPTMIDQNLDLKEKLASVIDRATQDAIALLLTERKTAQPSVESAPEWMTASQLARYWQLVNVNGEPTTAGILKWPGALRTNTRCHMPIWVIFYAFTEPMLIHGHAKKLRGDGCRTNGGV
jgi:hypothetical protein